MKKHFLVSAIFVLLIFATTFPLMLKINDCMPGFFSSDESYAPVWNAWWLKFCVVHKIAISPVSFLAHPFGNSYFFFGYLFFFINFLLAVLTSPVLTYNLQVLFNLFLTAFFTYLLGFAVTKNRVAAFLSGAIFGFCPYIMVRSWQHLGETYLWMVPMALWIMFTLMEKPTIPKKVLLIASVVLSGIVLGTAYYTLVTLAVFVIYFSIRYFINRVELEKTVADPSGYLRRIILLLAIGYVLTAALYSAFIMNSVSSAHTTASALNPYHRPFEDLFEQSARPLSYFLPSAVHPVFGKFTEQFVGSSLYGVSFTEHTLYLGWIPIILAFIAFKRRKKENGDVPQRDTLNGKAAESFNIGFFITLAIVAWFFSQPPWWQWGPLKVYMPPFFMYKILPMFRAYCRFGSVLMLAVAVLAGFGLKFYLERFKSKPVRGLVFILLCGLTLFEFWNYPPYKIIDVSKFPAVYDWLRGQPKDIVIAEYPLDAKDQSELYKFYQTRHERRMINASARGTPANNIALSITQLSDSRAAGVLKWLGVKYVLVHQDGYLSTELVEMKEEFNKIAANTGLKLVKTFSAEACPQEGTMCIQKTGIIDVYEVTAQPIDPGIK